MTTTTTTPTPPKTTLQLDVSGPISRPLTAALRARGITAASRPRGAVARLIATRSARPPQLAASRAALPWLWLAPRATSDDAACAAVLAGAYDVIDAGQPPET